MKYQLLIIASIYLLISCRSKSPEISHNYKTERLVTIESLIQKFDSIPELSYKVDQIWKGPEPGTIENLTGFCTFRKVLNDTIIGAHYVLTSDRFTTVYNSKEFFYADSVNKTVLIYDLDSYPNPRNRATALMLYILSYNEIMIDIKERNLHNPQSITFLQDTIINQTKASQVKIVEIDTIISGHHRNIFKIIAFSKEDLLPIFATKIIETPGDYFEEQIIEANFSAYVIMNNPSNKVFDISAIPFIIRKISYSADNHSVPTLKKDDLAPAWSGYLTSGDSINSISLLGKATLLNFTSVNCSFCIKANEVLNRIDKKYKNSNLVVISVYPIDKLDAINHAVNKSKINHSIIYNADKMQKDYLINGYPNIFIIDQSGKLAYISLGFKEDLEKELIETIDRLLEN